MKYRGTCHCGKIAFEVEGLIEKAMACNCSICSRKGSLLWFVPRAQLTGPGRTPIVARMSGPEKDSKKDDFDRELRRLEARIEDLLESCRQLKDENRSLRQRQENLVSERAVLLQKNEQARANVESMIGRLKGMEHGA